MRCDECLRSISRHADEVFVSFGTSAFGRHGCARRYLCSLRCLFWFLLRELGLKLDARAEASFESVMEERQKVLPFPDSAPRSGIVRVGGMAVARRRSRRSVRPDPDAPTDPRGSKR